MRGFHHYDSNQFNSFYLCEMVDEEYNLMKIEPMREKVGNHQMDREKVSEAENTFTY